MIAQQVNNEKNMRDSNSLHLLIVDDDLDILESLKDVVELEMEGCLVEVASNVEQAKLLTQQIKPDIALLDIKLGQDNGLDLIPELKEIHPDIDCIMMTAYRDSKYTVQAVRFGANDYLYKPIKADELIQTLSRLMQYQIFKREKEEADKRFHTVFEQGTQWLFLLDAKGCLLDANQTAMNFINSEKTSVIEEPFWNTPWFESSVDTQKTIEKGLSKVKASVLFNKVKTDVLFNVEFNVLDEDGNPQIFDLYMKPVFGDENKVSQVVVECRNITNRKRAEEKIKALNETLELRVKERTIELERSLSLLIEENKERKKAEEQAKKASEAKSDFLSRMSHELRTPMNAILGFGQLLELNSSELNTNQNGYVKEILSAGNHLLELINEILDLTEIESGKLNVSMNEVELDDIVKQCLSLLQPLAEARQIKIIDNISGKGFKLQADFMRLKQVIVNLLSNAVKYNCDNGSIILNGKVVNKKHLRISITDTGEGISKEDVDKLFTSFERLNPKFNVEGTGIGLVIAEKLVELMGGNIGVESTLSEGSTFWIELEPA